jgi:purine-nucleoside phosphorylase
MDPYAEAEASARELRERAGVARFDIAVVLGSGWSAAASAIGTVESEFPVEGLAHFPVPAVPGHAATASHVRAGDKNVLVFSGRVHLYEGYQPAQVVHPVRTAIAAGCGAVVLTNAAGGIRDGLAVGQPVLVRDHINVTGRSPLTGPRFTDLTDLYTPRLRALARDAEPGLAEGVYAMMPGPHYETPAEIAMLRVLGADLVGMSTVLEAIAARELGAEVLAISLVTNLAAGLSGEPLSHEEVTAAGRAAAARVGGLLGELLPRVLPGVRPYSSALARSARSPRG